MNRYSRCVAYWESKFNPKDETLSKIGMTADEVKRAMGKYAKYPVKAKPKPKYNSKYKLTANQRLELIQMLVDKAPVMEIAQKFGITHQCVRAYRRRNKIERNQNDKRTIL